MLASVLASEPEVLLVDEPTQGVDIGARMEIYKVLREAAAAGTAVIVVSSDALEVAGLCDRVLIFSRGQVVKELGGVIRPGHPGGQGVTGGLGRGDPDDRAQAGSGPGAGGFGQDAGLAGSGRGVDHRHQPAVG